MKKNIKSIIADCIPQIKKDLTLNGLSHLNNFSITVVSPTKMKDPDWLACYRSNSIYGSAPIFWVRRDFYRVAEKIIQKINKKYGPSTNHIIESEVEDHFYKTIIHEIVHAICNLYSRYPILSNYVNPMTEEPFCEDMSESIMNDTFKEESCYHTVQKCLKDFYG
ncbi:MAG: hypothetical protein WC976_06145 [Caldisericia bacterium]